MDPYMPMHNSTALLPWCRLLMLMKDANPQQALDNALRDVAPPFGRSMYIIGTPTCPAFYYAQLNGVRFLLIDGIEGLNQAILLTAGYVGTVHPAIRNPQNAYLNDAANNIVTVLKNAGFAPPINLRIGGYSTGGAIAPFVPFWVRQSGWGDDRGNIITFGSPKSTGFRNAQTLGVNDRMTRVMNDDDPVPLFCPSALDYPPIIAVVGPVHAARLSNFVHCGGGVILSAEGAFTRGVVPPTTVTTFGTNIAAWLFAQESGPPNRHSMTEYEKRLIIMEQNNAHAFHVPQARPQRAEEVQRPEMNQQERRVVDAIAVRGVQQGHDPVVIPHDKIFRWVRVGRINCVAFGDKLVTITNTKKRALRMANSGNDFLRVMQRQAVVDPVTIVAQFDSYFQFAADAGAGFAPVLATVFPAIGN